MKNFLFALLVILIVSCKDKDKDPVVPNDGYTHGKTIEIYFNQEIPEGGKLYIDGLVLTAKTFKEASANLDRLDYANNFISTTDIWQDGQRLIDKDINLESRAIHASRSLVNYLSEYNNVRYNQGLSQQFFVSRKLTDKPEYIYIRISSSNSALKIKTENFPVQITVIN